MNTAERCDLDSPAALELRGRLVSQLTQLEGLRSDRVRRALLQVPRHLFVPAEVNLEDAYANEPIPIGQDQTISQPVVVALMTEALELKGNERVLEIGTGSGYQAAVLAELARDVCSVEIVPELAKRSAQVLKRLGYRNVHVLRGDGSRGCPERAPFDRVLATAATPDVPPAWFDQLEDGGVLVAPVGELGGQRLLRFEKRADQTTCENLGWVSFVAISDGPPGAAITSP
jgi:protein-L-isoaspartate(D-aspartate) O-methyltransferase